MFGSVFWPAPNKLEGVIAFPTFASDKKTYQYYNGQNADQYWSPVDLFADYRNFEICPNETTPNEEPKEENVKTYQLIDL